MTEIEAIPNTDTDELLEHVDFGKLSYSRAMHKWTGHVGGAVCRRLGSHG